MTRIPDSLHFLEPYKISMYSFYILKHYIVESIRFDLINNIIVHEISDDLEGIIEKHLYSIRDTEKLRAELVKKLYKWSGDTGVYDDTVSMICRTEQFSELYIFITRYGKVISTTISEDKQYTHF